ncbi:MAG: hypothetical protein V3T48_12395 [Vicinamibacterales bacterium]
MTRVELVSLALGLVLVTSITLRAQQPPARSDEELAKQLANPVASLVSLPLQFNWDSGVGPDEGLRSIVNFQPVLPMRVNDDWNLIGRFILPFVGQPSLVTDGQATFGTGDILLSGFLSPAQPGAVVWGVGPALTLPTTTDPFLGSGKWSVGPTGIVLKQSGPWTYGALFNHLWSYASVSQSAKNRPEVNQTFLQPFLSYTTRTGVSLGVSSEATANWEADAGQWTVPITFTVGKVTRLGPFPFQMGVGAAVFAASPEGGPSWKLRTQFAVLLPRQ